MRLISKLRFEGRMRALSTMMVVSMLSAGLLTAGLSGQAAADMVTAKSDTVGCAYHDVLWDETGYDKEGKPTPEMLALDVCTGITTGQELELFEHQNYAPGGLSIVRIDSKLYFVRMRDLEPVKKASKDKPKPAEAENKPDGAVKPLSN